MPAPRLPLARTGALVLKEARQVVRDPSSIMIAFVLPMILLFLFGFGLSLDTAHLRIGVALEAMTPEARSLAAAFVDSPQFDARVAADRRAFEADLVAGRIRGIVVIPQDFARRYHGAGGDAPVQVIADGSEPNTASFLQNYALGVWSNWMRQRAIEAGRPADPPVSLEPSFWFNHELVSRDFLVPGSIAIIMAVIGTLLTALVVSREWERGTMEAMMATPVSVGELLLGKLVPYFALGLAATGLCAAVAVWLFDVPFRGSPWALIAIASAFLVPALGQGLVISSATRSQFVAAQIALFSGLLPAVLLSGFIFEIESMPRVIRWICLVIPARYFVSCLQTVFLAGDVWVVLLPRMAAMLAIGAVFFAIALANLRKRID